MADTAADVVSLIAASLRRERARTGLSLTEVARRAGIAKSTLSQLESGTGNPSVETLWALGVALDVPFSRLVDPPKRTIQVIRAGEATTDEQVEWQSLTPQWLQRESGMIRGVIAEMQVRDT